MLQNFKKLFSSKKRIFIYLLLVAISGGMWWFFTDVAIMFGNYGTLHTYIDIGLSLVMIVGFPLFLMGFWHKSMLFGRDTLTRKSGTGIVGGIIGTIISGASCCGLTLASYFGLLPLMAFLPYDGLEIKAIATLGLLYALYDVVKNLEVCQVKRK